MKDQVESIESGYWELPKMGLQRTELRVRHYLMWKLQVFEKFSFKKMKLVSRVHWKREEINVRAWRVVGVAQGSPQCRKRKENTRPAEASVDFFLQEKRTQSTRVNCKRKSDVDMNIWPKGRNNAFGERGSKGFP